MYIKNILKIEICYRVTFVIVRIFNSCLTFHFLEESKNQLFVIFYLISISFFIIPRIFFKFNKIISTVIFIFFLTQFQFFFYTGTWIFFLSTIIQDFYKNFCKIRELEVQRRLVAHRSFQVWRQAIFHTSVPYIINGRFFRFLGQFVVHGTPLTWSLSRHANVNDRIVPCRVHLPFKSRLLLLDPGGERERERENYKELGCSSPPFMANKSPSSSRITAIREFISD